AKFPGAPMAPPGRGPCPTLHGSSRLVLVATNQHRNPPLYPMAMGLPTLVFPAQLGAYLMRLVGALICAGLLASGLATVPRGPPLPRARAGGGARAGGDPAGGPPPRRPLQPRGAGARGQLRAVEGRARRRRRPRRAQRPPGPPGRGGARPAGRGPAAVARLRAGGPRGGGPAGPARAAPVPVAPHRRPPAAARPGGGGGPPPRRGGPPA